MPRRIIVAGAVITREGLVLAAQRGPGSSLAGFWEFPGGKVEGGERLQQALARELREELGCEVEVGEYITTTCQNHDFGVVELSTFFCRLVGAEPQALEHSALRWLRPEDLHSLTWSPADVETVGIVEKRLRAADS